MKRDTVNKIVASNPNAHVIEIFCNQRYEDYHVRGQIDKETVRLADERGKEMRAQIDYRFLILVLVNDMYQKEVGIGVRDSFSLEFGLLFKNTERQYLEAQSDYLAKETHRTSGPLLRETAKNFRHSTFVIDLKEAGIIENSYLNESIRAKKSVILLDLEVILNKIEITPPGFGEETDNCLRRIYALPAFYVREGAGGVLGSGKIVTDRFDDLYETLYFCLDYNYLNRKKYYGTLIDIGFIGDVWIRKGRIGTRVIQLLNQLQKGIGDRTYPLTNFCYKFLDDLVDDLLTQKQITRCQLCGDFFKCFQSKKYCSLKYEGKDCGKKARYRRWYEKHKRQILPKARKEMKETRALYKKLGLKK